MGQLALTPNVRDTMYTDEFFTQASRVQLIRVVNFVIETIKSDFI